MRILLMAALMAVFSFPVQAATWSPGDSLYVRHACFSESAILEVAVAAAKGFNAVHTKTAELIALGKCAYNPRPYPPVAVVLQEIIYEIVGGPVPGEVWKVFTNITLGNEVYKTAWIIIDLKGRRGAEGV